MDDTKRPPLQGLFAKVTEFKVQLKEMRLQLHPATMRAANAHKTPANAHKTPADAELQAVLLELQAENTDLKSKISELLGVRQTTEPVSSVSLQTGLSSFENPRERHPMNADQQDRVSASRQDEGVSSKTDESLHSDLVNGRLQGITCMDIAWTNGFGDTCKENAKSGIQPDWEDETGVRADVACCKFGGGSKRITA